VAAETNLVGPIPNDWEWWLSVVDPATEFVQLQTRVLTQGQRLVEQVWGDPSIQMTTAQSPTLTQGSNARLLVQLMNPQAVEEESASIPIKYEGIVGLPVLLQGQGGTQGGLTAEEHGWLDAIQIAVNPVLQFASGAVLNTPIGALVAHPDVKTMSLHSPCDTLTGDGFLQSDPVLGFGSTYGLLVSFSVIPPGFGKRIGSTNEYQQRLAQFSIYQRTADQATDWVADVIDIYTDGQAWFWRNYDPVNVAFSIAPGVECIACRFIVLDSSP
jgi:hypothetical protein